MKKFTLIAIVGLAMIFAACGNNNSNTNPADKSDGAPSEVAYEQFTIEKYGVTIDILKGMRRTDEPISENGGAWTLVPEDDEDFPIFASVDFGVYESAFGPYDDERIQEEFNENIPEEAVKELDLANKEHTYSVGENIKEFHRVIFRDNQQITVIVAYTERWEPMLGGEVRDHIMNSIKFN